MQELLKSYRETRYQLHKVKIEVDARKEYLEKQSELNPKDENIKAMLDDAKLECEKINWFMSNLTYAIDWLNNGFAPGPRRAIYRRSRDQRTLPIDPLYLQSYAQPAACGSPTTISDSERFRIDEALSGLSEREKQAYMLHKALGFSIYQTSQEMGGISKSTVQKYIERASKKIEEAKISNLFLVG